MNAYERMIDTMRRTARYQNPEPLQIGIVSAKGEIKIDSITLDRSDYLLDCNLRIDDEEKRCYHTGTSSDSPIKEYQDNILKKGDKVLLVKLKGFEKFVVVAKVVEAI